MDIENDRAEEPEATELYLNLESRTYYPVILHRPCNSLKLSLKYNGLSDITGLAELVNLLELDLSVNYFTNLKHTNFPPSLQILNLRDNRLCSITGLEGLTNLTELDLGHNLLQSLTGLGSLIKLKKLDLSYNNLESIEDLYGLTNLTLLILSFNNLRSFKMRSLVKLKKLDLSYNEDDGVVECFVRTPEGLKSKWHRIIEEAEWPMTLQTLHLNRIDNPLICAAIIKTLSATMLTKIYESTWEMDLTYEFTANQRQKIVTATEIINNLLSNTINESDIDFSKIDVRSMPNIINAVAYTQHCDQQILQQHMTPNNIGKLKFGYLLYAY